MTNDKKRAMRRHLFLLGAAIATLGIVVACSDDSGSDGSSGATPPAPPPPPTTTGTTPPTPPPPSGGNDAGADADAGPLSCAGKTALLLVGGGAVDVATSARTRLAQAGFEVTVVDDYSSTAADAGGSPVSAFSAAMVLCGKYYPDMPTHFQQELLAAHAAGTGIVFEEWSSWKVYTSTGFEELEPLMLFREDYYTSDYLTFKAVDPTHPIWAGVSPTFLTGGETSISVGVKDAGVDSGPSTVVGLMTIGDSGLEDTVDQDAIFLREGTGGAGRIAQTAIANDDSGRNELESEPEIARLYVNMMKWVARCE